jgi:hypothetical protein
VKFLYIRSGKYRLTRYSVLDREHKGLSKTFCNEHVSRLVGMALCISLCTGDPKNKSWHTDVHSTVSFGTDVDDVSA